MNKIMTFSLIAIVLGASGGALLRYGLGLFLNSVFPTIPLGTLAANLLGGFLIGVVIALTRGGVLPEVVRLGIITGFLGGLTTFSTFSAETITLLSHQQYLWAGVMILGHVGGSLMATFLGVRIFS